MNATIHTAIDAQNVRSFSGNPLLSDLLRLAGHPADLPCAGNGRCGKCRVVARGSLSDFTPEEQHLLTENERASGVRLACRARAVGDVEIWPANRREDADIAVDGITRSFPLDAVAEGYGVAVDIGTTTVAAVLLDLATGHPIATACESNPQSTFGADVISRIERSLAGEGTALAETIRTCIERLLGSLCGQAAISGDAITALVLTGNTTMLYLLDKRDVDCLSHAPFEVEERFGKIVPLSFSAAPNAFCYLPRCNSAFVGGDITTAVLASGMAERPETSLLIDVGTNGEIVLCHKGILYGASTAAGPALEGAGIYMGMPAVGGAVRKVFVTDSIQVETVGGLPDVGICGSGVVDAMAMLLEVGAADETGLLLEEEHSYTDRICEIGSTLAFRLGEKTVFTQKDIRAVQLAKSAICAGIRTLLHEAGLTETQVERFTIAGGFGSHIDIASAAAIGLFPASLAEKAEVLGNAALVGSAMLLQNKGFLEISEKLADQMKTVELSANPYFSDCYLDSMLFC